MSTRSQIVLTALLAALIGAGWFWLTNGPDAAPEGPNGPRGGATLVLVEELRVADDKVTVRAIGTSEARRSATIYPSVSGEVMEVAFDAGDRVKQGQPLVRLDDKHQRLAVRLAEVELKEAGRQVERLEKLVPRGAASAAQLETAQTAYDSARLRRDQARQSLRDRTVHAPFDGVIGLTDIDRGDRVTPDTAIATLDDLSTLLVDFIVPEEFAPAARIGETVVLQPFTMPDTALEGEISALGSRIDPVTRTLRVKARITNPDLTLRPGMSFEVRLAFKGRPYPTIPEVAVLWSRDGAYVWRVADGRIEKVFVRIVRRDRGRILVDGPLGNGDMIVVEGVQGLRVGEKVRTALAGEAPKAEPAAKKDES